MSQYREGSQPIPGYTLVEFLGRGSYGEVWKATGPGGTEVAVKFIALDSQQGLKEFKAIGLVKRLRHPNLVPIHAFWLCDSLGNVISDAPAGESLETESSRFRIGGRKELVIAMGLGDQSLAQKADSTRAAGGIAPGQLLRYMDGAARGIDFLNEPTHPPGNSPIIHCDIKPANLLIVGGEVQVCDYGVAQALGADAKKTLGAGTPAYAPPELINNDPCPQTDQYSLAITYYELRTGRLPFDEKHALRANITGELDLSLLERDERAVVRRATSLQPERRYPSVQDFADELRVACGVSLSRSAVIPRARERRPPPQTPFSPPPVAPAVLPRPAAVTPAAPFDTVSFPESLRPTVPAPKPAPRADDAPWAEGTALITALPSTPAAPVRTQWVWPLVIGLVLGIGGIVAFVVTRPPSVAVVATPPGDVKNEGPKPPVGVAPTAADLLKKLGDLTFGTAADVENAATRIDEALKTPALPASEADKLRAALPEFVRPKLKSSEGAFDWLDTRAVPDLPLGKDRDLGTAQKWYAAAADFTMKRGDKDTAARFAELRSFAEFVGKVVATATHADRLGYYSRAFDDRSALSPARRSSFLFKPLAADSLTGLPANRHADAAKLLVAAAAELPRDEKAGVGSLLRRAVAYSLPDAVAAMPSDPADPTRAAFSTVLYADADRARLKAYDAIKKADTPESQLRAEPHVAQAIALYDLAIQFAAGKKPPAMLHRQFSVVLFYHRVGKMKTDNEVQHLAEFFAHLQLMYIIVAEGTPPTPRPDATTILSYAVALKASGDYAYWATKFRTQKQNRPFWDALQAECAYMESDMGQDALEQFQKALSEAEKASDAKVLVPVRDRMQRLVKLHKLQKTRTRLADEFEVQTTKDEGE